MTSGIVPGSLFKAEEVANMITTEIINTPQKYKQSWFGRIFYYPRLIAATFLMMIASFFKIMTVIVSPKELKQEFRDNI